VFVLSDLPSTDDDDDIIASHPDNLQVLEEKVRDSSGEIGVISFKRNISILNSYLKKFKT